MGERLVFRAPLRGFEPLPRLLVEEPFLEWYGFGVSLASDLFMYESSLSCKVEEMGPKS